MDIVSVQCLNISIFLSVRDVCFVLGQLLEKSRGTLQTQFDQWYANLHARDGQLSHQSRSTYHTQQQSSQQQMSHSSSSGDSKRYDDRDVQRDAGKKSPRGVYSADAKPGAVDRGDGRGRGSDSYSSRGGGGSEERHKIAASAVSQSQRHTDTVDDSDEEVNEDIEAFYKAKEELLKRRSNNS